MLKVGHVYNNKKEHTMNAKTLRIAVIGSLLVLATAALAFAQPGQGRQWGPGDCPGLAQIQELTPEQRAKLDTLMTEHRRQMFESRQDIWAKQTELDALSRNPNTTPERITQLVNELKGLRAKQFNERESFRATLQKEGLPGGFGNCADGYGGHGGPRGGRGMMKRGGTW